MQVFTHRGIRYRSDKAYTDAEGIDWRFTGTGTDMSYGGDRDEDAPLSYVADFYGPLKER